ncbi:hypothetical protein [Pontibacter arcticus]|uniref:Uncharacterized protein n=1 Tax=Pontibacter arcticus TaxID=2080288 RepID=A0A364RD01_9BACT|nr:hypothetical protein [Pontibacter arcticus]RAU82163.1 hypothetical protein DP923_10180 [Pontibacter arcticus]
MQVASSALWIFFGVMQVWRYTKTGDQFLLWTGLLIGAGHLVRFIITMFRTPKAEVYFSEIEKAAFKSRNGNKFLDLKLRSGLKRRIRSIEPVSEELKGFLAEKQLPIR